MLKLKYLQLKKKMKNREIVVLFAKKIKSLLLMNCCKMHINSEIAISKRTGP